MIEFANWGLIRSARITDLHFVAFSGCIPRRPSKAWMACRNAPRACPQHGKSSAFSQRIYRNSFDKFVAVRILDPTEAALQLDFRMES
jgi:hypothetical protein